MLAIPPFSKNARAQPPGRQLRGHSRVVAAAAFIVLGVASAAALQSAAHTTLSQSTGLGPPEVRVRKNVTSLTNAERRAFVEAIVALKRARSPYDSSLSYYDQFVEWHKDRYICRAGDAVLSTTAMPMIHTGPMFLAWHREFLLRFEDALRDVSGAPITVPYWDWTDPESVNPDNPHGVFREDFMGGDGDPNQQYAVTTGQFRKGAWTLNIRPEGSAWAASTTTYLTRRLGAPSALPSKEQLDTVLAASDYDVPPYSTASDRARSFRNALEGSRPMQCGPDGWMAFAADLATTPAVDPRRSTIHNLVHAWVGGLLSSGGARPTIRGTMALPTGPNDPVFFLHHANVDRLWAAWQAMHPGKTYQPEGGHAGSDADSAMPPFTKVTPRRVEHIQDLGYRYQ